ncbi:MAG: glycoside hydrolase family 2 TIM barrel-domain containing protein, partial [Candidatus Limnocylindria bacterium]
PLVRDALPLPALEPGGVARLETAFLLGGADRWSPARPALYVLRVSVTGRDDGDRLYTSFGLRHVAVDPRLAQVQLNGIPASFTGVGLHDERLEPLPGRGEEATGGHRITAVQELLAQLDRARQVDAELIRAGHTPANPLLLMLADRLGFAVWEEIPLYHYTPLTFDIAMQRGIPQQMLREMALRDMNRPSVLFHGLANESTGTDERLAALRTLHQVDRQVDGTRLTGQASYGFAPDDPTHAPLDVAGYTFYYGVFYREDAAIGTARALAEAHAAHPGKPLLILEFGRWADDAGGPALQQRIFEETYAELDARSVERGGYVAAAVWWALEDFATMRPGIGVEHFGLFDAAGEPRPAAASAARLFSAVAGEGVEQMIASEVERASVAREPEADLRLVGYLGFALLFSIGLLGITVAALTHRGGRATGTRSLRRGVR